MATGTNIRTYFEGTWHEGNIPLMRAADHGMWLGSGVFDGARQVYGVVPDLDKHCERVNRSAEALMLTPWVSADEMVKIVREGLALYPADAPVYIRPMYWGRDTGVGTIPPVTGKPDLQSASKKSPWRRTRPQQPSRQPVFAVQ